MEKALKQNRPGYRGLMERAAGIYVLVMFIVFPLFVHNGYLEVSDDKYYVFTFSTIALTAVWALLSCAELYRILVKEKDAAGLKARFSPKAVLKRLSAADRFFILFYLVLLVSTLSSQWLYEAFWGNMGRLQGLYTWTWYFFAYFLVSRFYRHRSFYIAVFAAVGALVALWGVTDVLGFDILHWTEPLVGHTKYDFSSTFGNINILTAVEAIYASALSVLYVNSRERRTSALLYAALTALFLGLIAGRSDSAVLTLGAIVCFLPFYAWDSLRGFGKWLHITAALPLALVLMALLLKLPCGRNALGEEEWGVLLRLCAGHTGLCAAALAAAAACCLIHYVLTRGREDRAFSLRPRLIWLGLGVLAAAAVISVIVDANSGGHPELYAPYRNFLIFDEDWGTYRGFIWDYLVRQHRRFSFFKRLVGSGPETFGVYTQVYEFYTMISKIGLYFDNPHSEVLDFYFNTGILGVLFWYGTLFSLCVSAFRSRRKSAACGIACAFAFAIAVYVLQSVVNLATVMTYALLAVIMGMTSAILRDAHE